MGWRIATSTAETSGTSTSATDLVCVVYRGQLSSGTPIGTFQPSAGTTNTVTYAVDALTKSNVTGDSWFVAFAGHRSADTTIESPPVGMSLIAASALVASSSEVCAFDTNNPATANWPSTDVAISGTASGWQTVVIEIKAEGAGYRFQNYQAVRGGGSVMGFSERID